MQTWHLVERSVEHVLKQFKTHEDVATGRLLTLSDLQVLLQGGPKSKPPTELLFGSPCTYHYTLKYAALSKQWSINKVLRPV